MAVIDRAWGGFGREVGNPGNNGVGETERVPQIFTDTGRYSILFNANLDEQVRELGVAAQRGAETLDRRAVRVL